jgi:hypothetical protein
MTKSVLVIVGAGASRDLIPFHEGTLTNIGWFDDNMDKPPLTQHVFRDDTMTKAILDKYQGARNLAATIRLELLQNERPLEPLLKEYSESTSQPLASQFVEIPLYLQDLFAEVSKYTNQPTNYQRLAQVLFADEASTDRIVFVTLNYETLLDDVLFSDFFGRPRVGIESYVGERCMLVKLHGSVNWVRALTYRSPTATFNQIQYLAALRNLGFAQLKEEIVPDIQVRAPTAQRWEEGRLDNGGHYHHTLYYPALSIPLGSYDPYFACPAEHIEALKAVLPECNAVLAIGTSARDGDLLGLLRDCLKDVVQFHIVDSGPEATDGTWQRLREVPQLNRARLVTRYPGGFSEFILSGGPERFVDFG